MASTRVRYKHKFPFRPSTKIPTSQTNLTSCLICLEAPKWMVPQESSWKVHSWLLSKRSYVRKCNRQANISRTLLLFQTLLFGTVDVGLRSSCQIKQDVFPEITLLWYDWRHLKLAYSGSFSTVLLFYSSKLKAQSAPCLGVTFLLLLHSKTCRVVNCHDSDGASWEMQKPVYVLV